MNAQRLNDIYKNIHIAEKSDIESIKQLTVDYPFYHLPYVVLAKYYFDTSHYKFEDMLRQAAMRVKDRKELYHYIHGDVAEPESSIDPDNIKYEEETEVFLSPVEQENTDQAVSFFIEAANVDIAEPVEETKEESKSGLQDFLADFNTTEDEKPEEFIFEGKHENISLADIEIDSELIGEEIRTEFSFSKSFAIKEETEVTDSEAKPNVDLRKNPVYNVETFIHEAPPAEHEGISPEKDFFAWLQHPQYTLEKKETTEEEKTEKQDNKIELIEKFININPQISRPKKEFYNPENMAKKSEVIDLEYVTETLANIYYEQGNLDLAVKAYEKLSLQNPSKQAYFASLIEKIKKEKK